MLAQAVRQMGDARRSPTPPIPTPRKICRGGLFKGCQLEALAGSPWKSVGGGLCSFVVKHRGGGSSGWGVRACHESLYATG